MKLRTLVVCLLFVGACSAKEHEYQHGTLVSMDSSSCASQQKRSKTVAGEIFGTDGQHKQTQQLLCQQYILQSHHVFYPNPPTAYKRPRRCPSAQTSHFP